MTTQELLTEYTKQQQECIQQLEQLQVKYHQLTGAIAGLKQALIETETTNEETNDGETEASA